MDSTWLKPQILKSEAGQTAVEYILLLVVAISLVLTFYRSATYQRIFGENGQLGAQLKSENEFAYRHAYLRNRTPDQSFTGPAPEAGEHPSYSDKTRGKTRFFGPKNTYGTP